MLSVCAVCVVVLQQIREEKKLAEPVKVAAVAKKSKAQVPIVTLDTLFISPLKAQ
jgi:hypothetical protein